MTSTKRKLKTLSLKDKLKLIKEVDEGRKKKKTIAEEFGIPANTLSTIYKNRDNILKKCESSCNVYNKRLKSVKHPDLEKCVLDWLQKIRDQNLPVSGPILRDKADYFAKQLGYNDFKSSVGWLDKFRQRHNVIFKSVYRESASVYQEDYEMWMNNTLNQILIEYNECDIFNADETGLFFKCFPHETLTFKGDLCHGGKRSKERVTLLLGANMSGTEKLLPLMIGKSKNPRCFSNIKSLPIEYKANKKAWITSEIYENWLINLDELFNSQKRKIALFVDNCPAHPKVLSRELKAVKVLFFPANMSSKIQPMNQGIIQNFKHLYRKIIIKKILCMLHLKRNEEINLLDCLREVEKAWMGVSAETIINCFRKAGFKRREIFNEGYGNTGLSEDFEWMGLTNECDIYDWNMIQSIFKISNEVTFEQYTKIDDDVIITDYSTDSEIIQQTGNKHNNNFEDDTDSEEEELSEAIPTPSLTEATFCLDVFRRFMESKEGVPLAVFRAVAEAEDWLTTEHQKSRQNKITEYFL